MTGALIPPFNERFYGVAEVARALGVDRAKVSVWVRRQSHEMPPPDIRLAMGPIWRKETIEPWIERFKEGGK